MQIVHELLEAGVDVQRVEIRAGQPTPVSIILVNRQSGSRTIINRKGPMAPLDFKESSAPDESATAVATRPRPPGGASAPAAAPKVLLFDGHELAASLSAMAAFPEAVSILDAGSLREGTAELAHRVDYVAASARFATQATGVADLESDGARRQCVARLRAKFNAWTIVTLGAGGLVFDDGHGFRAMPAFPAQAVVDTTGAGDIFHGALAYGLAAARPLEEALRLAQMAASLSVRKVGGRTSVPMLGEVEEALRRG